MKKLILLASILLFYNCSTSQNRGDFAILPTPSHFEVTGSSQLKSSDLRNFYRVDSVASPIFGAPLKSLAVTSHQNDAQLILEIDSTLDLAAEGYTLKIADRQIHIKGQDEAGLFYGVKSLEQLMVDTDEQKVFLPTCEIEDAPRLSYRAVHLDVKHHIDKKEYYYRLIDKLASYKINAMIAEVEDKLKYKRRPLIGSADALSIEEWRKLSDYALARHISISPLIQGLGHAAFILKHAQYHDLRDNKAVDWAFNPEDDRTYELQFDLYRDALEAFPYGKYLHVGGDEVDMHGKNITKSAIDLQLYWLNKVSKFAQEHNRIPIFWDDMPLKQSGVYDAIFQEELTQAQVDSIWQVNEPNLAQFLDKFPKNVIYMRWNYDAPGALGNIKAMDWFTDNGFQVMGATAGQVRTHLMPPSGTYVDHIRTFSLNSIESGLNGLLLTLWDDDSPHFELYIRSIVTFAECTWVGDTKTPEQLLRAYRQREFSHALTPDRYSFTDGLFELAKFWEGGLIRDDLGEFKNDYRRRFKTTDRPDTLLIGFPDKDNKGQWSKQYQARLAEAEAMVKLSENMGSTIDTMLAKTQRNKYTLQVYEQVNNLAGYTPRLLLALQRYDEADDGQKDQALQEIAELRDEFFTIRQNLEAVYGDSRILEKPAGYILDQDHHLHTANQTLNFDWLYTPELHFMDKIKEHIHPG